MSSGQSGRQTANLSPVMDRKLLLIVALGLLMRMWGINHPWKTNDHYNWGGVRLTQLTHCFQQAAWDYQKAIPRINCQAGAEPVFYPNHPPTTVIWLGGLTSVFGDHEWVYRMGTLLFSVLNIFLIFRIGSRIWSTGDGAYLAALFQSVFLGTIYFGTHVDVLSEMTVSFLLVSTWMALQMKWARASLWALAAGIHSWFGYLMFAPLMILAIRRRQGARTVFAIGAASFLIAVGMMLYLLSSGDIMGFLKDRFVNVHYIDRTDRSVSGSGLFILQYIKVFISSHARMLAPLFAAWAFYELIWGRARNLFRMKLEGAYEEALLLTGSVCLITSIVGYQYVMIHIFWFILWMPFFALLCTNFVLSFRSQPILKVRPLAILILLFASFYPYGIFQTSRVHDVANSILLAGSALYFLFQFKKINHRRMSALILIVGFANFSQTVNYRNEPPTDYEYCQRARKEFNQTKMPVRMEGAMNMPRSLYCEGIEFQK